MSNKIKPKARAEYYLAKMGGQDVVMPEPILRDEYFLKDMADNITASMELPKVTAEDNGKVLAVVNGRRDKVMIGGGNANVLNTPAAFTLTENIERVDIPSGVTSIGNSAFRECHKLNSVTIPEGVTSIGNGAFYECVALTGINIPNTVTSIGDAAFNSCGGLKEIVIPSSVESIGIYAFQNCFNLEKITINKAEGSIGGAPWGAPTTTQIIWAGDSNE